VSSTVPRIREELLEPLRRTAGWLASLRDGQGRIVCPEHRLEHTGKSACAAILFARLAAVDGRAEHWRGLAIEQGRRLVANLRREGTSPCHTFWPGRHDPFNNSNHVIDGGSCSDALAELALTFGAGLPEDDRKAFAEASVLHARTYLRYAVLDKGIPAQRAWGLTGLAGAFALGADPELERAGIEAVGGLEAIQNPDGSFPYHPLEWGAEHPGSADASAFYQSRVTAFTLFGLERLGRDCRAAPFAPPLVRGLEFLEALQGPDGIKVGLVEAKPWYWGAAYEVASHPFDVFALARGGAVFGRRRFARAALRAHRAWARHLGSDGRPASHADAPGRGTSYQCPLFWAAHACWAARALPELERELAQGGDDGPQPPGAGAIDLRVLHFKSVDLARVEDGSVVAWIRGARPPYNVHHGSPHGGGLLRAVRKPDGAELVQRLRLAASQEGEWSASAGAPRLGRGWSHGGRELRFALWLARHQRRTRRPGAPWSEPLRVLRRGVLDFASPRASSAFPTDAGLELRDDGVRIGSRLAWRGGEPVPKTAVERLFTLDGAGLLVRDELRAEGVRDIGYPLPARALEAVREGGTVAYRLA
jgi:hypothetical protein